MKPRTSSYFALRRDPKDGSRTSVEMLNMDPNKSDSHSIGSQHWTREDRRPTLRDCFSAFSWRESSVFLTVPLALAPIIALAAAAEIASLSYIRGRDCYPNGSWKEATGATWRIMDSSYFFTPNLSFGAFTFTQVKVIDVAWDLIIGRGGQILLAWVNYRVFNEWLVYHMEMHLTSYKLYAAIAFQTTTAGTLGVLAKEFLAFGQSTWKRFFRWLAILSMLLSTLYVLSFPTLLAAMTGYIATSRPYVEDLDHNLIELSQVGRVSFIIEDATRIGYAKPLIVTDADVDLTDAVLTYWEQFLHISPYVSFSGSAFGPAVAHLSSNESSIWSFAGNNVTLPTPSLNMMQYSTLDEMIIPEDEKDRRMVVYTIGGRQGDVFDAEYLLEHGSCKPSEDYQWGFSYIFLFMVSIFNFIWTCIMIGMWLDTRRGSRMYKSGRRPGLLRSILDYSAAIREELGTDLEYLEEEELRKRVKESGGAMVVPKTELRVTRASTGVEDVRKRSWKTSLTKGSTF